MSEATKKSTRRMASRTKKVIKSPPIKKTTTKSKHPKFSEMISVALKHLSERGGSSKQALLKYISANYNIEAKVANHHLKVALKKGVNSGLLTQSTGIGASGSFKLVEKKKPRTVSKKVNKKRGELELKKSSRAKNSKAKAPTKSKVKPKKAVEVRKVKTSTIKKKEPAKTRAAKSFKSKVNNSRKTVRTRAKKVRILS